MTTRYHTHIFEYTEKNPLSTIGMFYLIQRILLILLRQIFTLSGSYKICWYLAKYFVCVGNCVGTEQSVPTVIDVSQQRHIA